MGATKFIFLLFTLLLNLSLIISHPADEANYKPIQLGEVYSDTVSLSQMKQYSVSHPDFDDEYLTVTVLELSSFNVYSNITFCIGFLHDGYPEYNITQPNNTTDSSNTTEVTPSSNSTEPYSFDNSTSSHSTNDSHIPPIESPLPNLPNHYYEVYKCSVPGQQTIIIPPLPHYDNNHHKKRGENITLYINVTTTSESSSSYVISASPVLEALSDAYQVADDRYIITGTVKSGIRQYYHYHPKTTTQHLQIESCSSVDKSGNNNPIWGAFLFNRTDDHWEMGSGYNQTLADYPCGLHNNGNSLSVDPLGNQSNSYLFICPSYVVTHGPFTDHAFFAVDILLFRHLQRNGSLSYRIVIDSNASIEVPLHPANLGNPSYVYSANFTIRRSTMDAVVYFDQITAGDGSHLPDVQYALFSDIGYSKQETQYLKANTSLSSSCFLLANQEKTIISSWFPHNQLTIINNSSRASFIVKDFYTTYDNRTFEVNLVGYSHTKGSFAYTYQTIDTTIHYNLDIWMSVLIVIGSIVATIAVFLVLGVVGYFAYIKYQNRSKYELL